MGAVGDSPVATAQGCIHSGDTTLMATPRILVVDDNPAVRDEVETVLRLDGFEVLTVGDGKSALEQVESFRPDLMVLDVMLVKPQPDAGEVVDGIELLRKLREHSEVPVLMLTETTIGFVKVAALSMGADDYLTKPFDPAELVARIRAILRRATGRAHSEKPMEFGHLRIDPAGRRAWKDDEPLDLSAIEFDLLSALARQPGTAVSREELLERAWPDNRDGDTKVVETYMRRLRKKIEADPKKPAIIVTVRGKGYRFKEGAA